MTAARAWITMPLAPRETWRLIRNPSELHADHVLVWQVTVGKDDAPALSSEAPGAVIKLDGTFAALEADSATREQWRALAALFTRMSEPQRRRYLEIGAQMTNVPAEPAKEPLE
jgi:hypothetical protein